MAVPDYQTLMLPLLKLAGDGQVHSNASARDDLALALRLSEEDRREMLPSGRQAVYDNRVGWALTYLKHAGLLRSVDRGRFVITELGRQVLKDPPSQIDNRFLRQFPTFVAFQTAAVGDSQQSEECQAEQTPEEALESTYQLWRQKLAQELLDRVKACSPRFFEQLVIDLLLAMGYGGSRRDAAQAVGQTGDTGMDGIIKEDRLGLDAVYIQAKRWENSVGRPAVQAFAGSLDGHRARKGIMITTSTFADTARDYVGRIEKRIILLDGPQLAELMIDYGVGVFEVARYTVKRVDEDYFGS